MTQQEQDYKEISETLAIPPHAGVEGFILAIRDILKQPRVTSIAIDARGKVSFTRYARPEEPRKQIEVDFASVTPAAVVRNGLVREIDLEDKPAYALVPLLFNHAAVDKMYPVAWVVGPQSTFHEWHKRNVGIGLNEHTAYGLPILRDRFIPDETLLLCCSYGPGGALIDAQQAYKITIPFVPPAPPVHA